MRTPPRFLLARLLLALAAAATPGCGGKTFLHLLDESQQTTGEAVHTYCQTTTPTERASWRSNVNAHAAGDCVLVYCRTQGGEKPSFDTDCPPQAAPSK